MPDATVSHDLHKFDLKSLPDGWVELRQLSYYEMLVRRDKGSIASMQQQTAGRGKPENAKLMLESLQTWDRDYLFKNCIANHNLTNSDGNALDFNQKNTLNLLNPKIAMEIERLIDDLNGPEELDEDFPSAVSSSSELPTPEPQTLPDTDTATN